MRYYSNNIAGTVVLIDAMEKAECRSIIFSSSATVYGEPATVPCTEDFPTAALNPYGRTKLFIEHMLTDLQHSDPRWQVVLLRYFNPVGAHPSGRIGEDPKGIPNNLMPFVQQVAVGRRPQLSVYGDDYPTPDGTGKRDYIHVLDLADGHVAALRKVRAEPECGCLTVNLGTGKSTSVLELVAAFSVAAGKEIPMQIVARRPGDAAEVYAKTDRAGGARMGGEAHHRGVLRGPVEVGEREPIRVRSGGVRYVRYEYGDIGELDTHPHAAMELADTRVGGNTCDQTASKYHVSETLS